MGKKNNAIPLVKRENNKNNVINNGNKNMESNTISQLNGSVDKKKDIENANVTMKGNSEDHLEKENVWTANVRKGGKGNRNKSSKKYMESSKKDVYISEGNSNRDNEEVKKDLKKEMKIKEDERKKIEKELTAAYEQLIAIDKITDVREMAEAEAKQRKEIENLISCINSAISKTTAKTPKPTNTKMTSVELQNKLKEAKLKKKKINSKHTEEIKEANIYINYLEEQFNITKNYECLKIFLGRLNNLKKMCDEKLKEAEKRMGDVKQQQRKLRVAERIIKTKKEKHNMDVEESDIIRKDYIMPLDHHNSIVKPFNFFNRIIVKYCVIVEKEILPSNDRINLNVIGCADDVNGFINHLKNIDFTEKNSKHVGYQVIKNMLALYEGSFRSMEIDNHVFVQADKDMIYYCGMKKDVEKFKEVIKKAIAMHEKSSSNKAYTKSVNLDPVLARGFNKAVLKDIENKTNTLIKINYDEKKNEATAVIKGNENSEIEEAEQKLDKIFESLHVRFVELEEKVITALYKRYKYDLNEVRNELGLFIVRHKNGISVVGKKENIGRAIDIINNVKNSILSKTMRKKVAEDDSFLFNANFRNYIKNETGATVKIFNKHEYKELLISGTSEGIKKALCIIDELLENKKCVEVEISEKTVAFLLSGKAQKIKEIEMDTTTSIQINKNDRIAQIYGHVDKINLAKGILEQLVLDEKLGASGSYKNKDASEEMLEMAIDGSSIGIIIGRRGQTINKIQEETGVNKIHVDKEKKKIFIYGSKRAITSAKERVLDILKRNKKQDSHQERGGGDRYNRGSRSSYDNNASNKKNSKTGTSKTGRLANKSDSGKNGVYINTNDEEAFPSLQTTVPASSKKGKKSVSQTSTKKITEV